MIALDTNIFIYWLERNPDFYDASSEIIKQVQAGTQPACCSVLVLSELYNGSTEPISAILGLPGLTIIELSREVAQLAGKLRYEHHLKMIDAAHLASALILNASAFITNDHTLLSLDIPNLKIQGLLV